MEEKQLKIEKKSDSQGNGQRGRWNLEHHGWISLGHEEEHSYIYSTILNSIL